MSTVWVFLWTIEAYKWLSLAATDGDSLRGEELLSLKKIMTTRQIDTARARISQWNTAHQGVEIAASTEESPATRH